jgi:hypothetical protein
MSIVLPLLLAAPLVVVVVELLPPHAASATTVAIATRHPVIALVKERILLL